MDATDYMFRLDYDIIWDTDENAEFPIRRRPNFKIHVKARTLREAIAKLRMDEIGKIEELENGEKTKVLDLMIFNAMLLNKVELE